MSAAGTRLRDALSARRFAVTAELSPPRGADPEAIRHGARVLHDWVDAANVTDNQGAMVRLSSMAGSVIALGEDVEPVMQLQCRDRNRMALQSDLLGASALGITNVLLLTGDHQRFGDHPEARGVFDLDSVQLLWTARTMRDSGKLLSGKTLKPPPTWLIGAVENPFAPPLAFRAERLGKKIAAGAEFVQTQYVFDVARFAAWMQAGRDLGLTQRCAVLAGVGPIRSLRALERMRQIPGIVIAPAVEARLRGVPAERVLDESLAICAETITELRAIPDLAGVHVMAFGAEALVPEIVDRAGLGRRAHARVNEHVG
ncbi:MAG TPA: methylenetetrahydrofolate reductase [Candidatus Lustribacter sp.]